MPYPDIRLTRPIRRAIMVALFALFFVISPPVILYTEGYSYNWSERRIEQTGVISIDAFPRDADVFIDGLPVGKDMPLRLPNRAPGSYHLEIQKNGYRPWAMDISVERKQSTYIKDIRLFRDALPVRILADSEDNRITAFYPSPDGQSILLVRRQNGMTALSLYRTQTHNEIPITRTAENAARLIVWSPTHPVALIAVSNGTKTTEAIIIHGTTGEPSPPLQLDTTLSGLKVQWSRSTITSKFYVGDGRTIYAMTPSEHTIFSGVQVDQPWFIDKSEHVWTIDAERSRIITSNASEETFSLEEHDRLQAIIDVTAERAIVRTTAGIVVLPHAVKNARRTDIPDVSTVQYNESTDEWLAWSQWELRTIYSDGGVMTLNRTSEAMRGVLPLDRHGVLLLTSPTALVAFNPGYYVSHDLFRGGEIETSGVDQNRSVITMLGTIGHEHGMFELAY